VTISGIKTGTLLYFGSVHIAQGLWCGISLDEPEGNHDGLVDNVRYFHCRNGHGIFAPLERVKHFNARDIQSIKATTTISHVQTKSRSYDQTKKQEAIPPPLDTTDLFEGEDLLSDDDVDDGDDEILGLDEFGIIHDEDDEIDIESTLKRKSKKSRRVLPHVPPTSERSKNINKMDSLEIDFDEEKMLGSAGTSTSSAGGSSTSNEDTWSLNKDYLSMCDGKSQYLNIAFDGESESKTSTQEPSEEESPSPEFIFDEEMIEDGEFTSSQIQISRESSLGLISSITLGKNDLLTDIFGNDDEDELVTSQETLEPMSEEKDMTPDYCPYQQTELNSNKTLTPSTDGSGKGDLNSSQEIEETIQVIVSSKEESSVCSSNKNNNAPQQCQMMDSGISLRGSMSDSSPQFKQMMDSGISSVHGSYMGDSVQNSPVHNGKHTGTFSDKMMEAIRAQETLRVQEMYTVGHVVGPGLQSGVILPKIDDQQLMHDLTEGHAKKDRPISFASSISADTGLSYIQ